MTQTEPIMTGKADISPAEYLTGEPGVYRRPSSMSVTYHPGMAVIRRATIADSGDPHVPQDGLAHDNQGYEHGTSKENLTYFN